MLAEYIRNLGAEGYIIRDFKDRKYRLAEKGRFEAVPLHTWRDALPMWRESVFYLNSPIFPKLPESKENPWYETGLSASIHANGDEAPVKEVFRSHFEGLDEGILTALVGLIQEKRLLPVEAYAGASDWESIPDEKWDEVLRTLFGRAGEIVYVEALSLEGLLAWIRVPGAKKWLQELARSPPSRTRAPEAQAGISSLSNKKEVRMDG